MHLQSNKRNNCISPIIKSFHTSIQAVQKKIKKNYIFCSGKIISSCHMSKKNIVETRIETIITKYITNEASHKEKEILLDWVKKSESNKKKFNELRDAWYLTNNKINYKLRLKKTNSLGKNIMKAVAIIAVIALSFALGYQSDKHDLAESLVSYTKKIEFTTVSVKNGEKARVNLPDGSKVVLNSGSKIRYSNLYGKSSRIVYLTGEAYFEVEKSPKRFYVNLKNAPNIKVYGTKFNVKAYENSNKTTTTLIEGSIALTLNNKEEYLKPGEQSVYTKRKRFYKLQNVDTDYITSWTNGELQFKNTQLAEVIKDFERYYDIKIDVQDKNLLTRRITAKFQRNELLYSLGVLRAILPVKFYKNGEQIVVQKRR
jgi:ferric-dicitrate binding protein FerR (iron transport regulator)